MKSTKLTCETDDLRRMDWNIDTILALICVVKKTKQIILVKVNLNHPNLLVPQIFTNAFAFCLWENRGANFNVRISFQNFGSLWSKRWTV